LFTRYHLWKTCSKQFPDVHSVKALNDAQYAACLEAVHVYLRDESRNLSVIIKVGLGVQAISDRDKTKFGSVAERYNGQDGGRFFKWYSRNIFRCNLQCYGVTEQTCTERQCMAALAAKRDEIQKYPQRQALLEPFKGPQCFSHLDRKGGCYRGDASLRRVEMFSDPVLHSSGLLDCKRWKRCFSCKKWRFLNEDSARSLQDESFFSERETDLDWALWLQEAEERYQYFVRSQGFDIEARADDVHASAQDLSVDAGGSSDDDDLSVDGDIMSLEVRRALDAAKTDLGGSGGPNAEDVAAAMQCDSSGQPGLCLNRVHPLRDRRVLQLRRALRLFVEQHDGGNLEALDRVDSQEARACFLAGDEQFALFLCRVCVLCGIDVQKTASSVLKRFKAGVGEAICRRTRFESSMLLSSRHIGGSTSWQHVGCDDQDDMLTLCSFACSVEDGRMGDNVLLLPMNNI
jgi:hypothetical protein